MRDNILRFFKEKGFSYLREGVEPYYMYVLSDDISNGWDSGEWNIALWLDSETNILMEISRVGSGEKYFQGRFDTLDELRTICKCIGLNN